MPNIYEARRLAEEEKVRNARTSVWPLRVGIIANDGEGLPILGSFRALRVRPDTDEWDPKVGDEVPRKFLDEGDPDFQVTSVEEGGPRDLDGDDF